MIHSPSTPARRQRGLTMLGWLAVLVVVASLLTVALKITPHYVDFYTMQSVIESLPEREVSTMSRTALDDVLSKRFKINNLRGFEIRDIIDLERTRDSTVLNIQYERREHLFFNIDVVLTFNKRYEFR